MCAVMISTLAWHYVKSRSHHVKPRAVG